MLCLCYSLQPGSYSSLAAPNFQPTATQGMYNFRFTILINTNNTTNHQSTTLKKTHHTQRITTLKTRYQVQPSHKELHTEHIPLRTIILH